jgi:hypothetical protein
MTRATGVCLLFATMLGGCVLDTVKPKDDSGTIVTELRMLAYDDARGDYLVPGPDEGDAVAVRFDAPAGATLDEAYLTLGPRIVRRQFGLWVLEAQADGSPGAALYPLDGAPLDVTAEASDGIHHVHVDLRDAAIDVTGAFYVVMEWQSPPDRSGPWLGFDRSQPDGETWLRQAGVWGPVESWPEFEPMDAMIRAVVDVPVGSIAVEPVVLTNYAAECVAETGAASWRDSAGYLTASRITPETWPFRVDEVRLQVAGYSEVGGEVGTCDATTPFRVDLIRVTDAVPPETPEVTAAIDVALDTPDGDPLHQFRLALDTPIELQAGESLLVAVHMEHPDDAHNVCVGACGAPATAGTDFWSTSATPPYGWDAFEDQDINGVANLDIALVGEVMPGN